LSVESFDQLSMKLALVGHRGGSHLGGSFAHAAAELGMGVFFCDLAEAFRGPRIATALSWRLADRRPLRLGEFSAATVELCARESPDIMIALGAALSQSAVQKVTGLGIPCIAFCSDDPWNKAVSGKWHMAALPAYHAIFTPRRSNIEDFRALGCHTVHYLPFGFDDRLFFPPAERRQAADWDVLFVGGADRDRVAFMSEFLRCGLSTALAGRYWDRFQETRAHSIGVKSPEELNDMTAGSKVNLCLVRRANRDGHVMRSFEIAAAGGCMLAEDTEEHREIFGGDGEAVVYFRTPAEAAERSLYLLANPAERNRLSAAVRTRVGTPKNTYRARLLAMLETMGVEFTPQHYSAAAR